MRSRNALALGLFILFLPACAAHKKLTRPAPAEAKPAARTYFGILPCPYQCKDVRTELTVFEANHRFALVETYEGTAEGVRTEESWGEWSLLKGHGTNPNADVYELTSEQFEDERYFLKVDDDTLRALDNEGKDIPTKENVLLRRLGNK